MFTIYTRSSVPKVAILKTVFNNNLVQNKTITFLYVKCCNTLKKQLK